MLKIESRERPGLDYLLELPRGERNLNYSISIERPGVPQFAHFEHLWLQTPDQREFCIGSLRRDTGDFTFKARHKDLIQQYRIKKGTDFFIKKRVIVEREFIEEVELLKWIHTFLQQVPDEKESKEGPIKGYTLELTYEGRSLGHFSTGRSANRFPLFFIKGQGGPCIGSLRKDTGDLKFNRPLKYLIRQYRIMRGTRFIIHKKERSRET
ncbi:MAG: hypothetical protein ACFFBQ_20225 [Promethearchaeota archaeon]